MIESNVNQREMTNFAMYGRTEPVANSAFLTSVDTAELENEIHLRQKTSHAEFNNTKDIEINRPQLTAPAVSINAYASSIDDIFKQFGLVLGKGIPIAQLKLILESIKDMSDKRWKTFENELNNLIKAQARVDKAIATLEELKANPDTPQDVFDQAKREAEDAFKNINQVLGKLNASIAALPPSADARRLQQLMNAEPMISFLDELLLKMQKALAAYMLSVPDKEFELYAKLQKATQDSLLAAADKMKKTQEQQGILFEVIKWVTLAVTSALTFASGGSLSFLVGLASAAFVAIDFGTGGVISEKVLNPIMTETIAPLLEKMVTGLTEFLKSKGCDESAAVAIATVFTMVAVAAATYGVGKGVSAGLGKFASTEIGKSIIAGASTMFDKIMAILPGWLKALPGLVAELDQAIIMKLPGLGKPGKTYEAALEMYLHRMSQLQVGVLAFGTAAEMAIQIATGFIEKFMKDFEGLTVSLTTRDEVIAQHYEKAAERVMTYIQNKDKYSELRSELLDSYRNTLIGVNRRAI